MTTEHLLRVWFAHNEQAILWLFACVLALVVISTIYAIFNRPEDSEGLSSLKEIENSLRKVIEERNVAGQIAAKAAQADSGASVDGDDDLVPAPMVAALREELEAKKADLLKAQQDVMAKNAEIDNLKKATPAPAAPAEGSVNAAEVEALKAKMTELEGRLAEYSIIEDDIADLSMYKEENAKLKNELAMLKSGAPAPAAAPAAVATPEAPKVEPQAAAPTPAPTPAPAAQPAGPIQPVSDDDPVLAEFAAAMAEQEKLSAAKEAAAKPKAPVDKPAAEPAPAPAVAPTPVVAAVPTPAPEPTPAPAAEASADPLTEELDTDRMLAEMADLNNMPAEDEAGAHILDADLDTEKMAAEAGALQQEEKQDEEKKVAS